MIDGTGRLVTIEAQCPEDLDGMLEKIRQIVMLGRVQSMTLRVGEPIVYQRLIRPDEELRPEESTQSFAELSLMEIVRNVPMEEFSADDYVTTRSPHELLMWMYVHMTSMDWVVTHLLVSHSTRFWKWLGITPPIERRLTQFMGARIERDKGVPPDVFILCGAKSKHASIAEIGFSLKGNVELEDVKADRQGSSGGTDSRPHIASAGSLGLPQSGGNGEIPRTAGPDQAEVRRDAAATPTARQRDRGATGGKNSGNGHKGS